MRGLIFVLVVGAACQPKSTVPTCEQVADHVLELLAPPDAFAHDAHGVFAKRCQEDQWSEEMRTCIGQTSSLSDPKNCKRLLVAAQAKQLDTELAAAEQRQAKQIVPAVCADYEKLLARALACDVLPKDVRDGLARRFAEAKAEWANVEDKRTLGPICSGGLQALRSATSECPGS